jgi:hypothetical protein
MDPTATGMMHELGKLLAVAIGQAEYLLHDGVDAPERRAGLDEIRDAVLRARDITRELRQTMVAPDPRDESAVDPSASVSAASPSPYPAGRPGEVRGP